MNKETIIAIVVLLALILFAVLYTTGIIDFNFGKKTGNSGGSSENIPQECRLPEGQDLNSWKEHLGHHENTKYCLQYFE